MTEQLLNRIEDIERRLCRWRLATFVLALLLISSVVVGGTVNVMLMLELPRREEIMMERMRAEEARAAMEQERQARQQAEQAEAAKKNGP
jgi:hypothetical protein